MYRRVRDLREDYDYTQEYLAKYLSCSQSAYSKIESGQRQISIDYLIKLSSEKLLTAYKEVKEKHDQIQEFEVVLAEYHIDKVVKEGLFIKMNYGVKKDGLELFKSSVYCLRTLSNC